MPPVVAILLMVVLFPRASADVAVSGLAAVVEGILLGCGTFVVRAMGRVSTVTLEVLASMGLTVVVDPVVEYSEAALVQLGVDDPSPNQVAAVAFPINALVLYGLNRVRRQM